MWLLVTRYLDDYAVSYLDEKRKQAPVVIYEQELKDTNEEQARQVNNLQVKLLEAQERIIALQASNLQLLEDQTRYKNLIEVNAQTQGMLTAANEELKQAQIRLEETERAAVLPKNHIRILQKNHGLRAVVF